DFGSVHDSASFKSTAAAVGRFSAVWWDWGRAGSGEAHLRGRSRTQAGARTEAAIPEYGPFSIQRGEQDRCEGARFGAGPFPRCRAEARLSGTLRAEGVGPAGAGRRRAGSSRSLRTANRNGGSVSPDGRRHVVLRPWRQRFPETRSGRSNHRHGFRAQPYRHHKRSGICRSWDIFSDVGAFQAAGLFRASARTAFETTSGGDAWRVGRGRGMMAGHGEENAGGGPARHIPVMLNEVLAALKPAPGEVVIDGTFGAGGYSRAILNTGANVIAIDRDPDAISAGRAMVQEFDPRL